MDTFIQLQKNIFFSIGKKFPQHSILYNATNLSNNSMDFQLVSQVIPVH